jgi:hypothetical protein
MKKRRKGNTSFLIYVHLEGDSRPFRDEIG